MTCSDGPVSCTGRARPEDDAAKAAKSRDLRIAAVKAEIVEAMRLDEWDFVATLRAELAALRGEAGPETVTEEGGA